MLAADDLFKKALALDPNQTDGLHGYSQLLAVEGRIKEALEMRLKLQALEPFVINYVADTALIYWLDKDDATAIKMLDEFRPAAPPRSRRSMRRWASTSRPRACCAR